MANAISDKTNLYVANRLERRAAQTIVFVGLDGMNK